MPQPDLPPFRTSTPDAGGDAETLHSGVDGARANDDFAVRIRDYYDSTQRLYSRIWSPTALHYGLWFPGTRSRQEMVRNTDRRIARELGLRQGSRILDAGCGIGGTSLYLAEELHHEVLGITLSPVQLQRARQRAATGRAPIPPRFELRDFANTGLADGSFDGVFAIESVCHARDKSAFVAEAFRLLRPGGRLVVADGFLSGSPSGEDLRAYRVFVDGLAIEDLERIDRFRGFLGQRGFEELREFDMQPQILPAARSIERLSRIGVAICRFPCRLGLFPQAWLLHGHAGVAQRRIFENGTLVYRILSATKPTGRVGSG